jgi:hypothetical protein
MMGKRMIHDCSGSTDPEAVVVDDELTKSVDRALRDEARTDKEVEVEDEGKEEKCHAALPAFVKSGYVDISSKKMKPHSSIDPSKGARCGYKNYPFVYTGSCAPRKGMGLLVCMQYIDEDAANTSSDGVIHSECSMDGCVTDVYARPSAREVLRESEAGNLSSPNFYGVTDISEEELVKYYGAVHGQRIQGVVSLKSDFIYLARRNRPPLAGRWAVELVCDDNWGEMWILDKMRRL